MQRDPKYPIHPAFSLTKGLFHFHSVTSRPLIPKR